MTHRKTLRLAAFMCLFASLSGWSGRAALYPLLGGERLGLGAVPLSLEGFKKALRSKVLVPQLGELFVLLVKLDVVCVIGADDVAAPLLHAGVIVAVVLCEAPDYVEASRSWIEERLHLCGDHTCRSQHSSGFFSCRQPVGRRRSCKRYRTTYRLQSAWRRMTCMPAMCAAWQHQPARFSAAFCAHSVASDSAIVRSCGMRCALRMLFVS